MIGQEGGLNMYTRAHGLFQLPCDALFQTILRALLVISTTVQQTGRRAQPRNASCSIIFEVSISMQQAKSTGSGA